MFASADGVTHIDVSGCFLGVRDSDSTSHYGNDWFLPTAIIKRLPYLQQLCCFSEGGADAVAPQLQLPPTKTFRDGIESMKNFFYGHETQNLAFIGEKTTQCFEDYFKKPIIQKVCIILDIISALWEHRQTDSSIMEQPPQQSPLQLLSPPAPAQQMFISIVSHKLSDSLAPAVGKFLDKHYARVSEIMNWKDHSGRTAGATALLLCKNAMLSRVLFMGLYDIPDGLQHEYKSATCTVYLAHHVEGEKRTTVALKFMKNADEFEREKSSREILLAPRSGQEQTFQDYIVESTDSYHHKVAVFHSAVQKRKWLVDYSNPCLLVMPAADRNLRIIMDNERITKPEAIKSMSHRIMRCAKYMHDRGFIHGDLKPRNIMRILHRLMLVDFDASAQVGRQYSWSKHSSAYMPPEAICVFMSLRSDEFSVVDASSAAQCTVAFNVLLPIAIPAGTLFTISIAPVRVAAVHKFTLDAGDWSSCISVKDRVITVTAKDALDAGKHGFNVAGVFEDSLPAAEFMRAELEHIVNTLHPIEGTRKDDLAKCTLTIRNPMKDAEIMSNESRQRLVSSVVSSLPHVPTPGDIGPDVPCECTCSKILPLNMRDASIPAGCIGMCGLAHFSHDMWALGVILYRLCSRDSLLHEDDEDNIKYGSNNFLDLALWTDAFKQERLQRIEDTATRQLVSRLLAKEPWKRPRSIDDVLSIPFNEMDIIKLKLQQTVPQDADQSSNLVGSVKDLRTGKFSDAAYGLRPYLKVAADWDEAAACTLQGMQDEVERLKDCADCAQVQADVLHQLHRGEATATRKLASALAELKEQRKNGVPLAAADAIKRLRADISGAGGWYYGMPNAVVWPDDAVKVCYGTFTKTFSQPMCDACKAYNLDYSSISADLRYIIHEPAVEKQEWNGVRDRGRAGYRLKDFMELPQSKAALLNEAELVGLRFYTSHSFNSLNIPMRDLDRLAPHPLPGIMMNIQAGLKKLRALGAEDASSKQTVVLWRGMSYMQLPQQFNAEGGTELAPMSTTTDVSVAISYAVKKDTRSALLFRFVTRNNLERGADVQWLSIFPGESETLFPPLTFLQRTRTEPQDVVHNGVKVTIVELSTTLA
jgi:serine/threonine protein kinase